MRVLALSLTAVLASAVPASAADPLPTTERISLATDGTQGDSYSIDPAISGDGRYAAYWAEASTLVPGDTNDNYDVFTTDRWTRKTTRVSVTSAGAQSSGDDNESVPPSINANARYIAFASDAPDLVPGDTNGSRDVFVHDRWNKTTVRVSVASNGAQANDGSFDSAITADGRYVFFSSSASNLVPGVAGGVFRHDRTTRRTTFAAPSGSPAISADGRYVAVLSSESNLVPGDTNGADDVFVRDTVAGRTTRVSVASNGTQGNDRAYYRPAMSENGRFVVFGSHASNLVPGDTNGIGDVFFHDRWTGQTTRITPPAPGPHPDETFSYYPTISANGRWVAYASNVANLVPGDTNDQSDVFFHDRWAHTTILITAPAGGQANGGSFRPAMSADGRYVGYYGYATNVAPGDDTNGIADIFVWRRF